MEPKREKLDIYLDPEFLIQHHNNKYLDGVEELSKLSFRRELLNIEKNNILLASNGSKIPSEEFNRLITSLLEEQKNITNPLSDQPAKIKYNQEFNFSEEITNPSSIFLINYENKLIDELNKSGFLFLNADKENLLKQYRKLSFNSYFSKSFEVKPDNENPKPFNFIEFREYALPNNNIFLIDPWLATWNIDKIEANILKIFDNLFFDGENNAQNRIRIISLYNKPPEKKYYQVTPKEIIKKITGYFNKIKMDIEVLFIKEFLFYTKEKKRQLDPKYTNDELYKICDTYFHDRLIFSNYFFIKVGRSFDINMKYDKENMDWVTRKYTAIDINSLLKVDYLLQLNTHLDIFNKIDNLKCKREYEDFFDFATNKPVK
jgi:hypothetical protein